MVIATPLTFIGLLFKEGERTELIFSKMIQETGSMMMMPLKPMILVFSLAFILLMVTSFLMLIVVIFLIFVLIGWLPLVTL